VVDAAELRRGACIRRRLRHDEIALTVDRHVGRDGLVLDGALHPVAGDRGGEHAARRLLAQCGLRDKRIEGGVRLLVANGLGVRDVAGNVLQRERLCLQTGHRGGQCIEDTHDITSPTRSSTSRTGAATDGPTSCTSQQSPCHGVYYVISISYEERRAC